MVRVLVEALNASNPGLNLGEEAIEGIESALRRLRSMLLCKVHAPSSLSRDSEPL